MSGHDTCRGDAVLTGRCHCGNLEVALESSLRPEELPLRADTCSFCRRHGARTTSGPDGRLRITIHHPGELLRYRFGLRTADFLICRRCGIYVAAVISEGGSTWATLNANALDAVDTLAQVATPVTYDGESVAERSARRRERWTPTVIVEERR